MSKLLLAERQSLLLLKPKLACREEHNHCRNGLGLLAGMQLSGCVAARCMSPRGQADLLAL